MSKQIDEYVKQSNYEVKDYEKKIVIGVNQMTVLKF